MNLFPNTKERARLFRRIFPLGWGEKTPVHSGLEKHADTFVGGIVYQTVYPNPDEFFVRIKLVEQEFGRHISFKFPGGGVEDKDKNLFDGLRRELRQEAQIAAVPRKAIKKAYKILDHNRNGPLPYRKYFFLIDGNHRGFVEDLDLPILDPKIIGTVWVNLDDVLSGEVQIHERHLYPLVDILLNSNVPELIEVVDHWIARYPEFIGPIFRQHLFFNDFSLVEEVQPPA